MKKWLLVGIIALGLVLRIVSLSNYPAGFTPDEASFGYDAYSLLKTGRDQWGASWPIVFRSFGDSKLPLYTYLALPSVAIFGLTEFATRFPNALVGTAAIFATYLMVYELFKKKELALWAAFLVAISPWHIPLSRGAFEANLTTFFIPLGVWAFYTKRFKLSALLFGLNLFTYHSARLVTPLVLGVLLLQNRQELSLKKNLKPAAIFGAFLVLAFYTLFTGGGSRAADVTILNPTDHWKAVADRRYEAIFDGLPNFVSRLFSNKPVYIFSRFSENYLTYFSPQFLFTEGPSEATYGMIPGRGVLYLIELPFLIAALVYFVKKGYKEKSVIFILAWILVSPVPAALTKGLGSAGNRAAVVMPALQIFSAIGAVYLLENLSKITKFKKYLWLYGFIVILFGLLAFFVEDYVYHAPRAFSGSMLYGRQEAMDYVAKNGANYKEILISRSLSEPQIWPAFYLKYDPASIQESSQDWLRYQDDNLPFVDQLGEYRLDKFTFKDIEFYSDSERPGILIIGKPKEFPETVSPTQVILFPNKEPAIYIYDPGSKVYAQKN